MQSQDSYGSPQAAPVQSQDSYGSPQAPAQGSYGAPQAPAQGSYGAPQAPAQSQYGSPHGKRRRRRREAPTIGEDGDSVEDKLIEEEEEEEEEAEPMEEEEMEEEEESASIEIDLEDVGVEKVIQVVSSGDLTFAIKETDSDGTDDPYPSVTQSWAGAGGASGADQGYICMSTPAFAATLVILLAILVISCLLSAFLCLRHRSYYGESSLIAAFANPVFAHGAGGAGGQAKAKGHF